MKRIFTILLLALIYCSSCKKDAALLPVDATQNTLSSLASPTTVKDTVLYNIVGYLRVQLAKDAVSTDNVLINFNSSAKTTFVRTEDAPYFPGFGQVSLSSLSSDNVALAINAMPLTKKSLTIGLKVSAKADGIYNLNMVTIKSIPAIFDIWLKDNYKKDSLDFRHNSNYAFNLYMADTASYGGRRFNIVLRENPALAMHLLTFAASTSGSGAQLTWKTENEDVYTSFAVERSTDQGKTFNVLTTITSTAAGTYGYLDKTPVKGSDQYRLKLVDLNGVVSYSVVSALNF